MQRQGRAARRLRPREGVGEDVRDDDESVVDAGGDGLHAGDGAERNDTDGESVFSDILSVLARQNRVGLYIQFEKEVSHRSFPFAPLNRVALLPILLG